MQYIYLSNNPNLKSLPNSLLTLNQDLIESIEIDNCPKLKESFNSGGQIGLQNLIEVFGNKVQWKEEVDEESKPESDSDSDSDSDSLSGDLFSYNH